MLDYKIIFECIYKDSIGEFNYLLQKESWQESLSHSDVNASFDAFMVTSFYHNTAFALENCL
jgi:hypothetical protein